MLARSLALTIYALELTHVLYLMVSTCISLRKSSNYHQPLSHNSRPRQCKQARGALKGREGERGLKIPPHRILKSGATLQITIEAESDVENTFDVFHRQGFLDVDGEGFGCADCVFDLAAI